MPFPCGGGWRYMAGMTKGRFLPTLCAALLIALASLASAALMAPARGDAASEVSALLLGGAADDICGTPGAHDHHCPFCRLIADPPDIAPATVAVLYRPHDGWRQLSGVARRAQSRGWDHPTRAPPSRA